MLLSHENKFTVSLNNLFIDILNELNKTHNQTPVSTVCLVYDYQKQYSSTEEMFLYKLGFISLITILSYISNLITRRVSFKLLILKSNFQSY